MGLLKKILVFLKDFLTGSLFPGLSIGFMLLIAAAMLYFRPQDYFGDAAVFPMNPHRPEAQLALRLLKRGAEISGACGLGLWLIFKIEAWWKRRPKRVPKASVPPKAP